MFSLLTIAYHAAPRIENTNPNATPAYVQDIGSIYENKSPQVTEDIFPILLFLIKINYN